jgi:CRISPR-associated protein Cas2
MPLILIDILDAPSRIEGVLSRRLIHIRPGVYVGNLSTRSIEITWEAVKNSNPRSAMLVYPAKNESGLSIMAVGEHRYTPTENYGLQLISMVQAKKSRNPLKIN